MAFRSRKKVDYDEDYDEQDEQYEDEEYEDDYDEDDYDDYDDRPRNPLKGVVIALVILALLMGAVIGLLYVRLQSAEKRATELTNSLNATRTELNGLLAEKTAAAQNPVATAPAVEVTPAPVTEPEVTPEPIVTPAPTEEPTPTPAPTPAPLLKDTVTDEALAGVKRPADESWLAEAKPGVIAADYMLALHWGPSMAWNENMALHHGDKVEIVAREGNWTLIRTPDNRYGWGVSNLIKEEG